MFEIPGRFRRLTISLGIGDLPFYLFARLDDFDLVDFLRVAVFTPPEGVGRMTDFSVFKVVHHQFVA